MEVKLGGSEEHQQHNGNEEEKEQPGYRYRQVSADVTT
jgi:hypothetical protein